MRKACSVTRSRSTDTALVSLDGTRQRWLVLAVAAVLVSTGCTVSQGENAGSTEAATSSPVTSEASAGELDEELLPALQAAIDQARHGYGAPGALAVIEVAGRRFTVASGSADMSGTPVTPDMRFRVGSITKPVIAALVLDEVLHGELSLEDTVGGIVNGPLRPEPPITVRMLLNHTSGVFDIGNEGNPVTDVENLSDHSLISEAAALEQAAAHGTQVVASDRLIVALAETHDRYFQPGTGYHYSNTNYQLAAMILEATTGGSLAELVADRIARPLGLERTTIAPDDRRSPEFRGHAADQATGEFIDATDNLLAFGNGANGGLLSTADELLTVMRFIVSGSLLSSELRAEMMEPTPLSGDSYGLGLAVYRFECGEFYGHEGRVNGTASIAVVDVSGSGRGVVVAFNRTGDDPQLVDLAEQLICTLDT